MEQIIRNNEIYDLSESGGLTYTQIAKRYGITRERVRQIVARTKRERCKANHPNLPAPPHPPLEFIVRELEDRISMAEWQERCHSHAPLFTRRELAGYTRGLRDALSVVKQGSLARRPVVKPAAAG